MIQTLDVQMALESLRLNRIGPRVASRAFMGKSLPIIACHWTTLAFHPVLISFWVRVKFLKIIKPKMTASLKFSSFMKWFKTSDDMMDLESSIGIPMTSPRAFQFKVHMINVTDIVVIYVVPGAPGCTIPWVFFDDHWYIIWYDIICYIYMHLWYSILVYMYII